MKLYIHSMPADIPLDLKSLPFNKAHEAHSFIFQFLQLLFVQMGNQTIGMTDIDGVARGVGSYVGNLAITATAGMLKNIIPGKGSTPPQPNDYKIQTVIPHGAGANALMYGIPTFSNPWVATPNIYAATQRVFTNTSGAPITVTEIALYAFGWYGTAYTTFCITRDILAAPATIQNGQAYRFIITFCTPVG